MYKHVAVANFTTASAQEQDENEQTKQEFNAVYYTCPQRTMH